MKTIIFGANGQDGYYLNQLLEQNNCESIGVSRSGSFLKTDITNYDEVSDLISKHQPEYIFHLAANSTTSHDALFENHEIISTGTLNILESVRKYSPYSKVFVSGSGLQFQNNNVPIKETDFFEARDAYSVSRIQSVYAARYFRNKFGIQTYIGYFFNHDSPRRSERHIAQKIISFVRSVKNGSNEKLKIGDIKTIKEWTYAKEVVEAIWLLVNQNKITEANLGSGLGYSIEDWLEVCFGLIGEKWIDYIELIDGFKAEYSQLISDSSLIHSLGWKPKVNLKQLAEIMMYNENT